FQIVQPFGEMTVLENVTAAALFARAQPTLHQAREFAMEQIAFVHLEAFASYPARQLSLANCKRLELAKSLAMNPRVLLLDEVNAGLNSSEIGDAIRLIRTIAARGITIILIEHLIPVVAELAQRIVVLHHGAKLTEGPPEAVFRDETVIQAYL